MLQLTQQINKFNQTIMPKHMTIYIIIAVALIAIIVGGVYVSKKQRYMTPLVNNEESASRLVMEVSRLRGLRPAPLGPDHQVAYGTLLFKYEPESNRLICAIMVSHNGLWRSFGEEAANAVLRAMQALSDPAIGGMFDTGGGTWSFEKETGKNYLQVTFPLTADPAEVNRGIDSMARVVPAWVTRWLTAVARIAHDRAEPPKEKVTLENDPYVGEL